jgi:nucleoside-diphosphate-sugar epimerase
VAGSTGQTGRRVVAQLRAAGVAVRAGARDVKKAQSLGLGLAGAELVHADVTEGVDALVDAIGVADAVVRLVGAPRGCQRGWATLALCDEHASYAARALQVCATGFTPSFNFGKDNAKQARPLAARHGRACAAQWHHACSARVHTRLTRLRAAQVDGVGTRALVDAAKRAGVRRPAAALSAHGALANTHCNRSFAPGEALRACHEPAHQRARHRPG